MATTDKNEIACGAEVCYYSVDDGWQVGKVFATHWVTADGNWQRVGPTAVKAATVRFRWIDRQGNESVRDHAVPLSQIQPIAAPSTEAKATVGRIQAMINDFNEQTKRVDSYGNTYRSISESRHRAIDRATQHLANGGNPDCPHILTMLVWS